jgi:hypothetical protein
MHQGQARRASGSMVGLRWGITTTPAMPRLTHPLIGVDHRAIACLVVGRQWSSMFTDWPLVAVSVRAARAHLGLTRAHVRVHSSAQQRVAWCLHHGEGQQARAGRLGTAGQGCSCLHFTTVAGSLATSVYGEADLALGHYDRYFAPMVHCWRLPTEKSPRQPSGVCVR